MKKVINVIIVLLICLFAYFCYFKYILKVDYVGFGDYKILINIGDSMYPILKNGDAAIIKKNVSYEKDDIVCYEGYSIMNIRTVTSVGDQTITVREKYTGNEDIIRKESILGKMTNRIPYLGNILYAITRPYAFLLTGILIATYLLFVYKRV